MSLCRARPVHAAERDGDMSELWRDDPDPECQAHPPVIWGVVLLIVAVAYWIGLLWAIATWG